MEVVDSFQKMCPQFLIGGQTPTTPRWGYYKKICQRWENKYQFATLYDVTRRIPVYSAYTLNTQLKIDRNGEWKNEPQLESNSFDKNMMWIRDEKILENYNNQAVDKDYKGSDYTRGHVFPNQFAGNPDQAESTFTFTNVAPQTQTSNGQWAAQVEDPMLKEIKRECSLSSKNPAYIVTGVVPGNNWIKITRGSKTITQGVNIPSYYWTAYCCTNNKGVRISNAYLAEQNTVSSKTKSKPHVTVNQLNEELGKLYNTRPFSVFGNRC
ncbi:endonuclease domain-containing 1 protein-like [Trichomycterus rosablanca]|uniref:endonuclease domain-containing 1 protein-like n=1 Tax=Trichomycterus rosablanca TaxID=2290929 RepID=UPI002F358EE9